MAQKERGGIGRLGFGVLRHSTDERRVTKKSKKRSMYCNGNADPIRTVPTYYNVCTE